MLLNKYKYVVDKGVSQDREETNEKRYGGQVDVDEKAFKHTARSLAGEPSVKIEIKAEWLAFKVLGSVLRCVAEFASSAHYRVADSKLMACSCTHSAFTAKHFVKEAQKKLHAAKTTMEKLLSSAEDFQASVDVDGGLDEEATMNMQKVIEELKKDLCQIRTTAAKSKGLKANSDNLEDTTKEIGELIKVATLHKDGFNKWKAMSFAK